VTAYVRMRLGTESYAAPVGHVLEVAELGEVSPVPGAPSAVLGVRNLRGQILPVIDLALLLGVPRTALPGRLLVAEAAGQRAGFAMDQVSEVGKLDGRWDEAESPLLTAVVLAGEDLVGVLDLPKLFETLEWQPT
jgi:purine-binding chemotaxis protein CheW